MTRPIMLAAALFLSAAVPASFAQTPTPAAPPAVEQKAVPAPAAQPPAPPATQGPAAAPAPAAPPAAPQQAGQENPASVTGACRTRKAESEPCACLKDPTVVGVSTAATDGGRNMCVIP
ncbi:MAG: hypothetical protein NW200_06745 [Hyphomonadaceae bacterium]|nr:hypothetical protein [Hyphomonadaceae bacterium]